MRYRQQLALALTLTLTACGDDDGGPASGTTSGTTSAGTVPGTGDATMVATGDVPTGGTGETTDSATSSGGETSTGEPVDPWQAFLDAREARLRALAEPLMTCLADHDTDNAVFSGCMDWRYAVQATYALHVVSRLTGDPSYLAAAEAKMTVDGLAAELERIESDALFPQYADGYAWLLALAIERERGTGKTDLRPHALSIAPKTQDQLELDPILNDFVLEDGMNASWAVLNLWQWATWSGDAELAQAMSDFAETWLIESPFEQYCTISDDADPHGSFAACLNGARAVIVIQAAGWADWLDFWLPAKPKLPLPADDFDYGPPALLSFTRSWGLWSIYKTTKDPIYRDLFLDHMNLQIDDPKYWTGVNYGYQVPGAGIYALNLTFED